MNYGETLEYIHRGFFGGTRPGLERVRELLASLGNPQDSLRFIHVAGTNGKGSFCAMTDAILREAGYRTGLYTSPYLERFNERMAVNGQEISDGELAEITSYVRPFADAMEDKPTEFELITAVAMVYFARHGCDPVVLEVGMGGRLDATNVISTPVLSVITGISLDHTAILGDTREAIATEKAGIIRRGVPVVFGGERDCAYTVIKNIADGRGAPFVPVDHGRMRVVSHDLSGTEVEYDGKGLRLGLLGAYQPHNAATVLTAIGELRQLGFNIDDGAIERGLAGTVWKGRFELLSASDPIFIADGSHNPEGIASAIESIRGYFGDRRVCLLSGVMRDKDHASIAKELAKVAACAFTLRPNNPRALDPAEYAADFERAGVPAIPSDSIDEAVRRAVAAARDANMPLIALGSLYMYGDVKRAFFSLK